MRVPGRASGLSKCKQSRDLGANNGAVIPFAPMLLGRASEPFAADAASWTYEVKWDGWRAIVAVTRTGVQIWTRTGREVTAQFPELQDVRGSIDGSVIVDCELVALDDRGHPRFERIRTGGQQHTLVAFDILRLGRRDLIARPLEDRRAALARVMPAEAPGLLRARVFEDGFALLRECERLKIEGVVAKRAASRYMPGVRSASWCKIRTEYGRAVIAKRMALSRSASRVLSTTC
jgi:bifunctional non-homologous end joining protein LigD